MRRVDALVAYAANHKDHPQAQIDALAAFITEVGFKFPIAIDEDDVIIAGHGRLLAAKQLGMGEVPCLRHVGLDETKKRALRIADNRLAELAVTNEKNLAAKLDALTQSGLDFTMIGYGVDVTLKGCAGVAPPTGADGGFRYVEQFAVIVVCKDEAAQKATYEKLHGEGYECKVVCV